MSLSALNRRKLKSLAHHLEPVVMVGHKGITDTLVKAVDGALNSHELIKVKFVNLKDEKKEIIDEIKSAVSCDIVDIIGNVAILYRRNDDEAKRVINI